MARMKGLVLVPIAAVLFLMPVCAFAYYPLEAAFENPALLTAVSDDEMVYISYVAGTESQLLAYMEYDAGVGGYGSLAVRKGGYVPGRFLNQSSDSAVGSTIWSYIAAKELGPIWLGLGVNQETREQSKLTFDIGAAINWKSFTVNFAVQRIGLGDRGGIVVGNTVSGVRLSPLNGLSLMIDMATAPNPLYRLSAAVERGQLEARFYVMGEKDEPFDPGIELGVRRDAIEARIGYHVEQRNNRQLIGLSLSYSF